MGEERVLATYRIETAYPLEHAAEVIAGEQSTGTFTAVPGETEELKRLYGAKVVRVTQTGEVSQPALPGSQLPAGHNGSFKQGEVVLSFPMHNFGASIPNLLSAVAGNLSELQELSGLRLVDLDLPTSFAEAYPGPKFGVEGTRRLADVTGRPVIGTIVKPSIGLPLQQLQQLVYDMAVAGLDFIKDDELNANPPYAALEQKVPAVMEAVHRAAEKTGRKLMYAFNITGDIHELQRNHDLVVRHGGTCVMVSINSVGVAGLAYLNRFSEVPIHGHRNQWGMLTRCPMLGMDFNVYQKLCRLAGADQLHVNGLNSKFYESNESVTRSIKACAKPLLGGYAAMPVVSSGQWAGMAHDTYAAAGSVDVMHLAGGGILAHPDGPQAGFESFRLAWEAASQGIELREHASHHEPLRKAIAKFAK